jgi:formate dehydrogenase beta subunit
VSNSETTETSERSSRGRRHPGKGKGRGRTRPRGRQAEPEATAEVAAIVGDGELRRDLLIEYLHAVQDQFGDLSLGRLAALAAQMGLPLVEVYEVASFYHNFDICREGTDVNTQRVVKVCDSLPCMLRGAQDLIDTLGSTYDHNAVRIERAACMGRCDQAPVARIGQNYLGNADPALISAAVDSGQTESAIPPYRDYAAYGSDGGYALLADCRANAGRREDVLDALDGSGLRGLGGAGFPTGKKWRLVAKQPSPRLMAVNGDESEPGTFKDRHYLLTDPHRVLEGMLIGAWAVDARDIYIYVRDEFPEVREILTRELGQLASAGLIGVKGSPRVHLRRGAGAYICGEESAMLESLEGKRGLPRHKPPFPAESGLFGQPTLINNVETLYWVRDIVERGPEWFASEGLNGRHGYRTYSVSGRVQKPGVVLAPAGTTARQLINQYCGGMMAGHELKAYLPGGASGGILPGSLADLPLDFGTLEEHGCFIGSAAIIVLSDQDKIKDVVLNLTRFFEDESCGQCTPCRAGTEKAATLMGGGNWDRALLEDLAACLETASICGLGQAAANPLRSAYKFFPEEMK